MHVFGFQQQNHTTYTTIEPKLIQQPRAHVSQVNNSSTTKRWAGCVQKALRQQQNPRTN